MTRKIPVASWNDDDSTHKIVDVDADELRAQRKAREAKVARASAPVKGPRDMLRYLAVHKLDPDFAIPAAVIDAIAIALAGKNAWSKVLAKLAASNDDRSAERDWRRKKARAAADRLRAETPGISDSAVARRLADATTSERTIRDYIKKD